MSLVLLWDTYLTSCYRRYLELATPTMGCPILCPATLTNPHSCLAEYPSCSPALLELCLLLHTYCASTRDRAKLSASYYKLWKWTRTINSNSRPWILSTKLFVTFNLPTYIIVNTCVTFCSSTTRNFFVTMAPALRRKIPRTKAVRLQRRF